jgi:hypothetical protein
MALLSQTLQRSAIHGATRSNIKAAPLKGVKRAHVATTCSALGMAVGFGAARRISSIGAPARGELLVSSALASMDKVGTEALPTGKVLQMWKNANAVCFDVDCK